MNWIVGILVAIFLGFIFLQFYFARKLKSKKGKRIVIDGKLGEILNKNDRCMIYFWTESCSVCKKQSIVINELSQQFNNVYQYNLSGDVTTAKKLGIMAVPTIFFVKNFIIEEVFVGFQSKESLIFRLKNF